MTKEIELTKGKVAIVDDEDFEWLSQWKWNCNKREYARRKGRVSDGDRCGKYVAMHREIVHCPDGYVVDHIDGNTLNNQKSNLRICTQKDNVRNSSNYSSMMGNYKGVTKREKSFMVRIGVDFDRIYIGRFSDEIAAANAYNYYAKIYHGEFAKVNDVPYMSKEEWELYRCRKGGGNNVEDRSAS